jgi:hypothetical protein
MSSIWKTRLRLRKLSAGTRRVASAAPGLQFPDASRRKLMMAAMVMMMKRLSMEFLQNAFNKEDAAATTKAFCRNKKPEDEACYLARRWRIW